jgi:hypothetical protein
VGEGEGDGEGEEDGLEDGSALASPCSGVSEGPHPLPVGVVRNPGSN